jgi:hypothetical protein
MTKLEKTIKNELNSRMTHLIDVSITQEVMNEYFSILETFCKEAFNIIEDLQDMGNVMVRSIQEHGHKD